MTRRVDSATHYYTRMEDCTECQSKRGERCVPDEENRGFTHISRLRASGLFDDKAKPDRVVSCDQCPAPAGVRCITKGSYLNKEHLSRRQKAAAFREANLEST